MIRPEQFHIPKEAMLRDAPLESLMDKLLRQFQEIEARETEYLAYRFLKEHPELTVDQCEIVREIRGDQLVIFVRQRQEHAILYGKGRNA